MEKTPYRTCSWDICNKRLVDFCFRCDESGKLYCSEECAERDIQEHTERKSRFLWN